MAAKNLLHAKLKEVHSLPCLQIKELSVLPKTYPSAQQLTTCTETPIVMRQQIFKVEDDILKPAICEWEYFPPHAKQFLKDSVKKSSLLLGKVNTVLTNKLLSQCICRT